MDGAEQTGGRLEQGGLAGAVGTEQDHRLARRHDEVDAPDGDRPPVSGGQALQLQRPHADTTDAGAASWPAAGWPAGLRRDSRLHWLRSARPAKSTPRTTPMSPLSAWAS